MKVENTKAFVVIVNGFCVSVAVCLSVCVGACVCLLIQDKNLRGVATYVMR